MSLFDKKKPGKEVEPLTPKMAQELYDLFRSGKTHTRLFIEDGVSFDDSGAVWNEIKKLEAEIMSKMSGSFVITPGIPAVYDKFGKLVEKAVPPVYFVVKDEKMLVESLKSALLDTAVLVTDVLRFSDGNPDDAPKWEDWVKSLDEQEM